MRPLAVCRRPQTRRGYVPQRDGSRSGWEADPQSRATWGSAMRILGRSRLIVVRRLIGLLLANSLAVSSAMASSMHVHQYAEHDHPEHHHGPAAHEHGHSALVEQDHHSATDNDHPAFRAESCDPGRHAVATTLGCAQIPPAHVDLGELPGPTIIAPAAPIQSATPVVDVRVHGPPFDTRIPARAPPLTLHA